MRAHAQQKALLVIKLDFEVFHGFVKRFQLANKVVSFESEFLFSNTHVSDFLFLINQFVPCRVKLLLAFVDFTHISACLKLVLLRELTLIFAKALDFLVESFNLEMGFIKLLRLFVLFVLKVLKQYLWQNCSHIPQSL